MAQPDSATAPATATATHHDECLHDIWDDSGRSGRHGASRPTPDTLTWIAPPGRWFNASRPTRRTPTRRR
jgi:hypothetical protein